jgi:hypothetical protein
LLPEEYKIQPEILGRPELLQMVMALFANKPSEQEMKDVKELREFKTRAVHAEYNRQEAERKNTKRLELMFEFQDKVKGRRWVKSEEVLNFLRSCMGVW